MRNIAFAVVLMASTSAFATSGGEPSNTGCNGVGNPNSPCVPSAGNPGQGGQGGNATARASARASATAVATQGQAQRQTQRQTQTATGGNASVTVQGGGDTYNVPRELQRVPDANAPAIWSNNPCIVGLSGGVAVAGFGASFGAGIEDRDCTRRANAQHLTAMGERDAAREVLCNNDEVRQAFARTGRPCAADQPQVVSVRAVPLPPVAAPARVLPSYCSIPGIGNPECR